ncbi:hypothetical protein BDV06DRAFT_216850 [Aspergillus oleicola]
MTYDDKMLSILKDIKENLDIKIALCHQWDDGFWGTFDHVCPSWMLCAKEPSLRFYKHRAVLIDNQPVNVLATISLGMCSIVDKVDLLRRRGLAYLRRNAGKLHSTTAEGHIIEESFAQLLRTGDRSLVDLKRPPGLWNFFSGKQLYPNDMYTTTLGLVAMEYEPGMANLVLDEIPNYVNEDGIVEIKLDRECTQLRGLNALVAFHNYDRGYELPQTLEWIEDILLLYYMARLLAHSKDSTLKERLQDPLKVRLMERVGVSDEALFLGMRLLMLGIKNHPDREQLADLQQENGGWEQSRKRLGIGDCDCVCCEGSSGGTVNR